MSLGDVFRSYGFNELWQPDMMAVTAVIAALYLAIIGPLRHRFSGAGPVSRKQKAMFFIGLFLFYATLGSPLDLIGHHFLFSAHMLQQSIMYLILPIFILKGLPVWFFRAILNRNSGVKKVFHLLTNPIFAVVLFNMLFSFYHLPLIFNEVMTNHLLHDTFHTILMITAFLMWWPVVCPVPEMNRISGLHKILYIFVAGLLLTPACGLITFANNVIYTAYLDAPQLFDSLPIRDDQQLGGVIMKLMQEFVYLVMIALVFYDWYNHERKKETENLQENLVHG